MNFKYLRKIEIFLLGKSAWRQQRRGILLATKGEFRLAGRRFASSFILHVFRILTLGNDEKVFHFILPNKLVKLPGISLLKLTDFLFSQKTQKQVFVPIIADLCEEYFVALAQNRVWKARWVRVRGTWSFFAALALHRLFSIVTFFIKAWKSVG